MKYHITVLVILLCVLSSCGNQTSELKELPQATYLQTEEFAKRNWPFSQAVRYGNILYLSGQIGDLPETGKLIEGGIIPETQQTMKNIQSILENNGSSMDQVIKCTCMLADFEDWGTMGKEYIKFFPNHKPARSSFVAKTLAMGAKIEIECMAYVE